MEKIELRVEKLAGTVVDRHWFAVFGVAGGTIGRGGQNKLVLPDTDAGVARVHAMVRLESDAAYIANLCERRSMLVAGVEVLSGQEVQLQLGAEVLIGPYSLRAVPPGTPANKVVQPLAPQATVVAPPAVVAPLPSRVPGASLASAPNPWADIPERTWGEDHVVGARLAQNPPVKTQGASLGELLGASVMGATPQEADNPFAMLGRVESGPVSVQGLGAKSWPAAPDAAVASATVNSKSSETVVAHSPVNSSLATELPLMPEAPVSVEPPPILPNVFDGLGVPPRPVAPASNRPLVIPADFDPFAPDLKKEADGRDPWAGGLPAQSLSQVANIKSDELIRSLPLKGPLDQALDNPAHSGLPKALEPKLETDPMRLFETSGVMDGLALANVQASRGPELVQVFNLPKSVDSTVASAELASGVANAAPKVQPTAASVSAHVSDVPAMQALGLLPTQGLDLAMFGGLDAQVVASPALVAAAPSATSQDMFAGHDLASTSDKLLDADAAASLDRIPAKVPAPVNPIGNGHLPGVTESAASVKSPAAVSDLNLGDRQPGGLNKVANSTPPISGQTQDLRGLMDAFLEGAGLAPGRVDALMTPEFMRQFGEAFRVAVQGTIELLAARSEIKREFRADVTIIAPRANNPLKFLPNADGVIMQMVGQSFPGFMKPVPSMKEAYFDLQVHQLALMAGIRAAYAEALARFDPAELEKRCDSNGGLLSKISTTARKAAIWDDYKQSYNAIRRHAEDDLVGFSGEAFVKAYDAAAQAAREYP